MAIIGVDIGTTAVKVLAATPAGEALAAAENSYNLHTLHNGFREQDPLELLAATEKTILQVIQTLQEEIDGFSFSSAMHSLIAINRAGEPVTSAIIWADRRSESYARQLRNSQLGKEFYYKSGAPIHAMLPLCKIAWIRDEQPEVFQQVYKFVSIKEFFFFRWFGQAVVDYSLAAATGLFNVQLLSWDREALQFAGIQPHHLSEPVPATHCLPASDLLVEKFGLHYRVPFVVGASDGCLANLNASGMRADEATITLGTSGAIRIMVEHFHTDPQMRVFNYILTQECYVLGGPTNNGGIVLEWLLQNLYPDLHDFDQMLEKIQSVPVGSEGLVCIPHFYGERAPVWDEQAKGRFYGVQNHHHRDFFGRAALEGVVFNLLSISKGLGKGHQLRAVWADGGLTRSAFIVQLIADVFNLPVYVSASSHGADRGAVLLGAYALGYLDTLAINNHKETVYKPREKHHQTLMKNFARFEEVLFHPGAFDLM